MSTQSDLDQLLTRERAARREAETARSRLSFLSEASRVLAGSLDYEITLENLAELIVPALGDFCAVDLSEEGGRFRRVAVADVDPERKALVRRISREMPLDADSLAISRMISTGESEWFPETDAEACLVLPRDAGLDVLRGLGFRSFMRVALPVHGQILGTISIARSRPGASYVSTDLTLAEELASRAGLAVDHARLYRASQEANRLKDEFLATLSHELRSPLSSALLCAQMLRRGVLDPEKTARALETIERKIRLEVRLVEDLIDSARLSSDKVSLEMRRASLAAVVGAAVEAARPAAEAAGRRLRYAPPERDVLMHGDEARLQQIVDNLLSNAIKFTPAGGSIDVELERIGNRARLAVRDTGIGIPESVLPAIFDRFRKADASLTRKFGGLGLGLTIARRLVTLHGGEISAESRGEGAGATFQVTFPLLPASVELASPRPAASRAPDLAHLDGVHVLVVDDDDDARDFMETLLASRGATVTTASSARQALELLGRDGTGQDVLVSDISMPEDDGFALLREIRARSANGAAPMPALAVTAYAGRVDRQRALAAGYRMHLEKPVDQDRLVAAVAELAGRRSPAAEAGRRFGS